MRTIHKHYLEPTDFQKIDTFEGWKPLAVQTQNGIPFLWVEVDTDNRRVRQAIFTHGTGHELNRKAGHYLGTYQLQGGALVFHVFAEEWAEVVSND